MKKQHHCLFADRAARAFVILALACPIAAGAQALAPNKSAVPSAQPTGRDLRPTPDTSCTATGTLNEGGPALGDGTWTKTTAKTKCRLPGTWTDQSTYTWVLKKSGLGQVTGKVTYHGIPGCTDDTWPATGTFKGKKFSVTATNPTGGTDECAAYFGYVMKIE